MLLLDEAPNARVRLARPETARGRARLKGLLLGYLQADLAHWPGADGMTLADVLLGYPQAAAAGRAPGPVELALRHPDLADEVATFFACAGRG